VSILFDIRLALRRFISKPGHTLLMTLALALGIGATTAVFSVVDQTVLRPAPFAHANRLVDVIDYSRQQRGGGNNLSPQKILGWQEQPSLFERFEAYAPRTFDVTGTAEPERIKGLLVSTGLLPMLGVQPKLGRGFLDGDGRPESDAAVLISEAFWRRAFGGQPDVLGTRVLLNDEPHTIVGVMPRRFRLTGDHEDVWLPIDVRSVATQTIRGFYGLGRLAGHVTPEAAQRTADTIADQMQSQTPLPSSWDLVLERKKVAYVQATTRTALFVLLGAVAFVLLITCANTASLFLSQAAMRQREMAIRSAIGAARSRLVREVLTESLVLAAAGGALGLLFATWGIDAIVAAAPPNLTFQATSPVEIDARILLVAAAMTLATGILVGIVPALRGSRPNVDLALKGATGADAGRTPSRMPVVLVVAEIAFSLILLVGAALMIRTFANLEGIEPGFTPQGLVGVQIELPRDKYTSPAARAAFYDTLREKLLGVSGISDTAVAYGVPPGGGGTSYGTPEAEGAVPSAAPTEVAVPLNVVSPEYFRTLRIPIVAGRTFTPGESQESMIVSRALANRFWPDGSAVGRRFRPNAGWQWQTVIGVVGDVEGRGGHERTALHTYTTWPTGSNTQPQTRTARQRSYDARMFIARSEDPAAAIPAIRSAIREIDRNQPVGRVALVEDLYAEAFGRERFVLVLMSAFGLTAMALTAAGIFGVVAQSVVRRRREIGIRVALGAGPADVVRLFMSRGVALALGGTALGLAGAFALTRFLAALLFEVRPFDPLSIAGGTAIIMTVALLACWLPARSAAHLDPAETLRGD
jgi:putative ABC transport system permease protein